MENTYTKPGFDARTHFYEHLKEWLNQIARATITSDFYALYIALSNYSILVEPFIRPEAVTKLKALQKELEKETIAYQTRPINKKGLSMQNFSLQQKFLNYKEELYIASKHLMLPVKEEEQQDFDDKAFEEGSSI